MKLAYFSPLNPLKSGISDFSEELIGYLKKYCEIHVFTDGYTPDNIGKNDGISVRQIVEYENETVRASYDAAVFHIGNNLDYHKTIMDTFLKYGGILELHDVCLHHMIATGTLPNGKMDEYAQLMKYCHGDEGEETAAKITAGLIAPPWEDGLRFPLCKHLTDRAEAIIVHSDFAKQFVKAISPGKPVVCIPLHCDDIIDDISKFRDECRNKLMLDKELLVFGAFGYMTENKRVMQTLAYQNIPPKRTSRPPCPKNPILKNPLLVLALSVI
jgi:hypothetical protein